MKFPLLAVIAGLLVNAVACKVPVFRYALERWETDPYRAVVVYRGSTHGDPVMESLMSPFRKAVSGNFEIELVDVEALTEAQLWQYDDLQELGEEPWLRLHYPRETGLEEPFWEGNLTPEIAERVVDSPVRARLSEAILQGASSTWLLLETGFAERDQEVFSQLETMLAEAASNLSLPEGVVHAEEVTADGTTADGAPLEMDDVLRTSVPLKIAFKVLPVGVDVPEEAIFRAMLRGLSPTGRGGSLNEPVAVAVFGRGRALDGMPASRMNAAAIQAAAAYLCGECSCQVKDQNPGVDLLLNVDWEAMLAGSLVLLERPLPALSGIGVGQVSAGKSSQVPTTSSSSSAGKNRSDGRAGFGFPLMLALAILGLLVAAGSFLMVRRSSD